MCKNRHEVLCRVMLWDGYFCLESAAGLCEECVKYLSKRRVSKNDCRQNFLPTTILHKSTNKQTINYYVFLKFLFHIVEFQQCNQLRREPLPAGSSSPKQQRKALFSILPT